MLKISRLSDYAVLLVNHLGEQSASLCSAKKLADLTHLSLPTVSKILKQLHAAGLLSSSRGSSGGYQLLRDVNDISVAEVIVAIEGRPALTECAQQASTSCNLSHTCSLKSNWQYINEFIYAHLRQVSIADMGQPLMNKLPLVSCKD